MKKHITHTTPQPLVSPPAALYAVSQQLLVSLLAGNLAPSQSAAGALQIAHIRFLLTQWFRCGLQLDLSQEEKERLAKSLAFFRENVQDMPQMTALELRRQTQTLLKRSGWTPPPAQTLEQAAAPNVVNAPPPSNDSADGELHLGA